MLGPDHRDPLASANNLALDLRALGDYQHARTLDQDTLTRCRRTLGEDHPNTLTSAYNLARDLDALGEQEQARHLNQDTLTHCHQTPHRTQPRTRQLAEWITSHHRGPPPPGTTDRPDA